MKLERWLYYDKEQAVIRIYANQPTHPSSPLHLHPNFTSTHCGLTLVEQCLNSVLNVKVLKGPSPWLWKSIDRLLEQSERSGAPGQTARCDSWWAAPGPRRAAGRPGRGPRPARRWRRSARPRGPAPRRGSAARTRPARSTQPPPPLRGRVGYIVCVININIASLPCSLIILSLYLKISMAHSIW